MEERRGWRRGEEGGGGRRGEERGGDGRRAMRSDEAVDGNFTNSTTHELITSLCQLIRAAVMI